MSDIQQQLERHLQALDSASLHEEYLRALGEYVDWQRAQGHCTAEQSRLREARFREARIYGADPTGRPRRASIMRKVGVPGSGRRPEEPGEKR